MAMSVPRRGFLGLLDPECRDKLMALGRIRLYQAGEVIYAQGDSSSHVRVVLDGSVKMTARSGAQAGRETLLEIRIPGDLLGERESLQGLRAPGVWTDNSRSDGRSSGSGPAHSATATTLAHTRAAVISRPVFTRFLLAEPTAWAALARDLDVRLGRAEARLRGNSSEAANRRLARALLSLSTNTVLRSVGQVSLRLSQAELASWIGVSTETVERILRDWRNRQIVETRYRSIILMDLDALMRIAGIRRAA